jgi:lipid-A-disaccharide synthase
MLSVRILISAGEASGEMYGALLIKALRRLAGGSPATTQATLTTQTTPNQPLEFFGVGGDRMRTAGCDTVVDSRDLSVVGISEILNHLPKIWGLFHKLIAEAEKRKPEMAIVIDSPAFNWRVARQMHKRGIPVVYYVCPQFWAWRQGRVRLLRKYVDKALVIFPFEEKFYRDRGVDAAFVGHPLADLPRPEIDRAAYGEQYHLDPTKSWITLMPGSRVKEVRMNLPVILESAAKLGPAYEFLLPVAPTLDRNFLLSLIGNGFSIRLVPETLPALAQSRVGIVASGTATVEAAMMGTPFVMVYRVSGLTYKLGRPRVKVPYFAMVNLIAGKEIVPELVQHDFTVEKVVGKLNEILPDGTARTRMIDGLNDVRERLGGSTVGGSMLGGTTVGRTSEGGVHPVDRAAEAVLAVLNAGKASKTG